MLNGLRSFTAAPLLLTLAGCSSAARLPSQLTRVPGVGGSAASAFTTGTARRADNDGAWATHQILAKVPQSEVTRSDNLPQVAIPNVTNASAVSRFTNDWVSLETWTELNHVPSPRRLMSAPGLIYELRTLGGVIAITAGSHVALLDGINWWLGYPPRFAEGRLWIHALDAGKNLLPLANPPEFPTDTDRVVVIDPGHGGENTGARSVADNHFEKEFTLDWALRLGPLLAANGWKVVLTRTNDVDVSLADRVAVADETNADLFLSLHFNSGARQDQSGLETYCLTPAGMPSTLTRDYEDDLARIFPNNAFDDRNLQYAVRLHRALLEETGAGDRGVRRARFMAVLRGQNRPAVLLEGGYLSNRREAQSIAGPEYRQRLAAAIVKALLFRNEGEGRSFTNATDQAP